MTGGAKPTVEEAVERLWLKVLYDDREIERPSPNTIVSAKDLRALLADRTALVSRIKELDGLARKVRDIEADYADFDGDSRGHYTALVQARENLTAAVLGEEPADINDA